MLLVWLGLLQFSAAANPQLLVDMDNGEVLYEREAGQPWHPASLTKLATAIVVFNAIDNGDLDLETPVIISARARSAPPSRSGLARDTAITMADALNLLIVKSANDVAIAIAETVSGSVEEFVGEMNDIARVLGMTATRFVNPHGLHDPRQVTTARDLALLTLAIRRHFSQYGNIFSTSVVRLGEVRLRTHNNLLTEFFGTDGMKTGFVCSAGLNIVATIERTGRRLMAIVLGASSARERGEMAGKLFSDFLSGRIRGTGLHVSALANDSGAAPVDMRPRVCGAEAKEYVAQRERDFPYGLNGQDSFLTDDIAPRIYQARPLGRLRDVPLPRPRPSFAPLLRGAVQLEMIETRAVSPVPLPRPRPHP